MENEGVLSECSVKKELPDEDTSRGFLEENGEIKNKIEVKAEVKTEYILDNIYNEAGENTEESHDTDIKGTVLDESYVGVKLETVSDEEVIKDEIDEPDFVSLDGFNETQEDADHRVKQELKNTPTNEHMVNTTSCNTSHDNTSKRKKRNYQCAKCGYQTRLRMSMIRHLERHKDLSERRVFACGTCGHKYTLKKALEEHKLRQHKESVDGPTFACDECEYKTTRKFRFTEHKLRHAKQTEHAVTDPLYKCEECSYQTNSSKNFKRHEQKHKKYKCAVCGRMCMKQRSLNRHMLLHMDPKDRPTYYCDMCNFKTIHKYGLTLHKATHVNRMKIEKNLKYKCSECSFQTDNAAVIKKHKVTHKARSERNLYECATCGRTYTAKPHLRQHMLLHMDPEKRPTYDCDVCDYKTIYQCRMKKHKLMHAQREKASGCRIKQETEQSQI